MLPHDSHRFLFVSAPFGGIEVYFRNLHAHLTGRSDLRTLWVWIDWHPRELVARIPPVCWNWTLKASAIARSRINHLHRAGERFNAALFNHVIPATFLNDFRRRTPVVFSLDNTPILLEKYAPWYMRRRVKRGSLLQRTKHRLTKRVYDEAAFLLTWTHLVKESLVNDYQVDPGKIAVVPPAIDLRKWSKQNSAPADGTGKRPTRILFVGSEFRRKGGDIVARVARRKEFARCEFTFVTHDYDEAIAPNIFIHNGIVSNSNELAALYRSSDIFVMPTRADFAPTNALCEAMAMELPIITTDVGGLQETVVDGSNGFVIPVDDEDALARCLEELISTPDLRTKLGRAGRRVAESMFDLERNATTILQYLEKAAQLRP